MKKIGPRDVYGLQYFFFSFDLLITNFFRYHDNTPRLITQQMATTANCTMRVGQGQRGLETHLRVEPLGIFSSTNNYGMGNHADSAMAHDAGTAATTNAGPR